MSKEGQGGYAKRTAVLVVHGIGSQRPLETMRGVVDAVWFDQDPATGGTKKAWMHPEPSGVDLDLAVMTTSAIPEVKENRVAVFHELYWAHLISETRAAAVLLWLFELARRGPRLPRGLNAVWWGAAIYIVLLLLAGALLAVQAAIQFPRFIHDMRSFVFVPLDGLLVILTVVFLFAAFRRQFRLTIRVLIIAAVAAVLWLLAYWLGQKTVDDLTLRFLAPVLAFVAAWLLMGKTWGPRAFGAAYGLSALAFVVTLSSDANLLAGLSGFPDRFVAEFWKAWAAHRVPWGVGSEWSSVAAWILIVLYLVANAAFLTPYLGDAARYFRNSPSNVAGRREIRRQAVAMLEQLHDGTYDRIIVAAHSQGTVVAYDMLRAYYSQIHRDLPDPNALGKEVDEIDSGQLDRDTARRKARTVVKRMAEAVQKGESADGRRLKAWLVTDFVTFGSPLTYAGYLMCSGNSAGELEADFKRRKREREFPTCPPELLDGDGRLTYQRPHVGRRFHHGGLFGLTRWTNLYFPISELVWGDPIGGPVASVFAPEQGLEKLSPGIEYREHIVDKAVYTESADVPDPFAHNTYWDVRKKNERGAPHIGAFRDAIDLADRDA